MLDVALGAVAAVAASALFSTGLLLQALEARRVPPSAAQGLRAILRLVRRPRWLLGAGSMIVGFGFHVSALSLAPLAVVQPSLAAGLLVLLLYAARAEQAPVGVLELAGVGAIGAGIVAVTLLSPERSSVSGTGLALALGLGALAVIAAAPQAAALARGVGAIPLGWLATVGAGMAYSLTGLTTKLVSDRLDAGEWVAAGAWLAATAVAAVLALLDQTSALQRRGATQVGVVIYVMPVIVPVVLAPALFGERWGSSSASTAGLLAALLVVAAGAAALASSQRVSAAEHPS